MLAARVPVLCWRDESKKAIGAEMHGTVVKEDPSDQDSNILCRNYLPGFVTDENFCSVKYGLNVRRSVIGVLWKKLSKAIVCPR